MHHALRDWHVLQSSFCECSAKMGWFWSRKRLQHTGSLWAWEPGAHGEWPSLQPAWGSSTQSSTYRLCPVWRIQLKTILVVWLDEETLLGLLRPRFNTKLRSLIQEIHSNKGTFNVAISWNIQQPPPEFQYLLLFPIGIHIKGSIFLMPWSLHASSQQCLGSYTAQTRARRRNTPGLQWGRSETGPQEWDGEGIWEVLHQPSTLSST